MGLDHHQLRNLVIRPTLKYLNLWSEAAEELVLGTGIQESDLRYINQLGGGPAVGIWQMEPATHDDIWENFLAYRVRLGLKVLGSQTKFNHTRLVWDLAYACAMSRIHYLRVPRALPRAGNIKSQARYWKQFYNTTAGKGTVNQYIANWHRTVG